MLQVNSSFVIFIDQYLVVCMCSFNDLIQIESYLTSKLSNNNNLTFWAKYSEEGKDCKITMALLNLAKRYLTPHPTSTNVERLFSTASNVLDGRNLNTESLEKLVFLKENLKLRNFALDWWTVGLWTEIATYVHGKLCQKNKIQLRFMRIIYRVFLGLSLIDKISEPVPGNL